ncbi:RDD family protein [Candidatus Bathyarchaeota archaeon]|nr:RDD family protein [Candidatus Bathyarchaeota archaeon]
MEGWAAEAEVAGKTSSLPIAAFKKRTLAFLMDVSLALAISILITLLNVISLLAVSVFTLDTTIIVFLFLLWGYSTLLEGFGGQSLGKRIMGLKVVKIDSRRLFYDGAAVRNFGKAFLLPFDLLIGLRLKDERFVRYFDKFAGTTVIDLEP